MAKWESHEEPETKKFYPLGDQYYLQMSLYNGDVVGHIRVFTTEDWGLKATSEGCFLTLIELKELAKVAPETQNHSRTKKSMRVRLGEDSQLYLILERKDEKLHYSIRPLKRTIGGEMVTIKRGCQLNEKQWANLIYYLPIALNDVDTLEQFKIDGGNTKTNTEFKLALQDSFCRVLKNSLKFTKEMLKEPGTLQKIIEQIKSADPNEIVSMGLSMHPRVLSRYSVDQIITEIKKNKQQDNTLLLANQFLAELDFIFNGIGYDAPKAPQQVAKRVKKTYEESLAGYRNPGVKTIDQEPE